MRHIVFDTACHISDTGSAFNVGFDVGTDVFGEIEVSAWECRGGLRGLGLFVRGIVVGFTLLGLLIAPLRTWRAFDARYPPPAIVTWLFRWLAFRLMLGAGLIKIRGDACWRELTCLTTHYETQPIPNPLSWWLHHSIALFLHSTCTMRCVSTVASSNGAVRLS